MSEGKKKKKKREEKKTHNGVTIFFTNVALQEFSMHAVTVRVDISVSTLGTILSCRLGCQKSVHPVVNAGLEFTHFPLFRER